MRAVPIPGPRWRVAATLLAATLLAGCSAGPVATAPPASSAASSSDAPSSSPSATVCGSPSSAASATSPQGPSPSVTEPASGLPPAASGRRWETMGDAVLQVPNTWGYAPALGPDWCAFAMNPRFVRAERFVAYPSDGRPVMTIGCNGWPSDSAQSEHVEWRSAQKSDAAGAVTHDGWVYSSRLVGGSYITYVHRPTVNASGLLDTARQVRVDALGCPATMPAGDAARPAPASLGGAPDHVTLCQYVRGGARLSTSTRLDAAAAAALLSRIEAQPTVQGPRLAPPTECVVQPDDLERVVARFESSGRVREVWIALGSCRVPTTDDGMTYREVTRPICRTALTPPLVQWTFDQGSLQCVPDNPYASVPPSPGR